MAESKYVHKSHNVSVVLYHVVCTAKYRRVVLSERVDEMVGEAPATRRRRAAGRRR